MSLKQCLLNPRQMPTYPASVKSFVPEACTLHIRKIVLLRYEFYIQPFYLLKRLSLLTTDTM
jgi:hypothetical protein